MLLIPKLKSILRSAIPNLRHSAAVKPSIVSGGVDLSHNSLSILRLAIGHRQILATSAALLVVVVGASLTGGGLWLIRSPHSLTSNNGQPKPGSQLGTSTTPGQQTPNSSGSGSQTKSSNHPTGLNHPTLPTPPPQPPPVNAFFVTNYGADPSGRLDSTTAIQAAINAAQAAGPNNTVYFPAGNYTEDSGVLVTNAVPVTLLGVDRSTTTILYGSSKPNVHLLSISANHITVQNLTFDASKENGGGGVVTSSASYTLIEDCTILGGPDTSWPLRFAGGGGTATAYNPTYATGNVVNNLILHDYAPPQNDGLDFPFQENGSISNVVQVGSRLGLYIDQNVTVTNYNYTPQPTPNGGTYGYFITTPSNNITITNFTSSGNGGKIGPVPTGSSGPRGDNSNITINNEKMTGSGYFFIGDVSNLIINNSSFNKIIISPNISAQGTIYNSTCSSLSNSPTSGASVDIIFLPTCP